jgi:hypothetical protein
MIHSLTGLFRQTWYFWIYFICVGFAAGRETDTALMSKRVEFVSGFAFALMAAMWVATDARRRQRAIGYGFPALVFLFWPVFAPIYLFQTRGARAWVSLLGFLAVAFGALCFGAAIGMATHE